MYGNPHGHVPLDVLWQYNAKKLKLTKEQSSHAIYCKRCINILSLCTVCATLDDLKEAVKELESNEKK
jgi:hypothetical protein